MENSSIKADYVYYCEDYIDSSKIDNISQLSKYVKKYNYGDLVAFSDYRDTDTFIIGKEGKLVYNPDYSGSGYLTIPYEITQYLDDATLKYSETEAMFIDLRYDDKLILEKINLKNNKLPKDWKYTYYTIEKEIQVEFPDKQHSFDVNNTSAYQIKKWYKESNLEQSKLNVYCKIEGKNYDNFYNKHGLYVLPKIPSTWSITSKGSGGGLKSYYLNYTCYGPSKDKEKVVKTIKKLYEGFNYTIS